MALANYQEYLKLLDVVKETMSVRYDAEADVLYVNLKPGQAADDSKLTEEDVIVRYDATGGVIGYTILHAQQR